MHTSILEPDGSTPSTRFSSPQAYTPRHLAAEVLTSRSALEGERKQVTVLFCDLVDSTALAERLGPDAMHGVLNRFFELALAEVHRCGGTINQFLGDGFMALFGAPIAYEDHAQRAVLAAVGLQQRLQAEHAESGEPPNINLRIRMGLNTGLVVVGGIGDHLRMDYTAVGDTTHLAARLQQRADPGSILLTEGTHRLVEGLAEVEPLGPVRVKGSTEAVPVYRLLGVRAHSRPVRGLQAHRLRSPLLGRDAEVATLLGCIERLFAGHGGIVSIIGDPGLGKSRLLAEVRRQSEGSAVRWLEGAALPFGQLISYRPFMELLRSYGGITEQDDEATSWAKLEQELTALVADEVPEILPYVATLLALEAKGPLTERVKHLDGEAMRRQVFRSTRRLFERLARDQRLVLVFEDVHWLDQSSATLLEHLLPLVESVPLLICLVSRPEVQTPAGQLQQLVLAEYADRHTKMVLAPLSPADSTRLVHQLLLTDELPPRAREAILQKAEGNPFFVEEVIRALIDLRAIVRDEAAGRWRGTAALEQLTIPDTIQGVLMARIDQLDDPVKEVLKTSAVIGRSFFYRVLRAVTEADGEVDRYLAELQQLDLIRERRQLPELEYVFKHALTQEATYDSILLPRRRELHRQVGQCIEALFPERREEFFGLLAYHYTRAEDWPKAQEYLFKAGDQAGHVAADAEALAQYEQALAAYSRAFGDRWDPLQRASLERKMGEALLRRGEHQQAREYLERALGYLGTLRPTSRWGVRRAIAQQIVQQIGHLAGPILVPPLGVESIAPAVEERARIYEALGWTDYWENPARCALDVLALLNLFEQSGFAPGIARGSAAVGIMFDSIRLFPVAGRYHRRAAELAEHCQHPAAVAAAYLGLAIHEYQSGGQRDAVLNYYQRAATAFWATGELRAWGTTTAAIGWMTYGSGDFGQTQGLIQELIRVGQEGADQQVEGWGWLLRGSVLALTGGFQEAVAYLEKGIELVKAVPDYPTWATGSGQLGLCYWHHGNLQQALTVLEEGEQLIARRGLRGFGCTPVRVGLAAVYLTVAEQAEGRERAGALGKAKQACRTALTQSKYHPDFVPCTYRLQGTYEWLQGKSGVAQQWWQRSLEVAERSRLRYDLGMTRLEIGKRLGDHASLQRAEAILGEIGATFDLAQTQELLKQGGQPPPR